MVNETSILSYVLLQHGNGSETEYYLRLFYGWVINGAEQDPFERWLYVLEIVLYIGAMPINLMVCWAVIHTNTFHPNLRLTLFNNIFCGIFEIIAQSFFAMNILLGTTIISADNSRQIAELRSFFTNQVLLCFLNVFVERYVAYKLSARYEHTSLAIGISILISWWIFTVLLTYFVNFYIIGFLCVLSPCVALFLANRWIRRQTQLSRHNTALSTRYQMSENVKTLSMCRYWVYLYFVTNVLHTILLNLTVYCLLKEERVCTKVYYHLSDLSYAFYVMLYPLFLVYGHQGLKNKLKLLFGNPSQVSNESYHYSAEKSRLTNREDFNGHFKRLAELWN